MTKQLLLELPFLFEIITANLVVYGVEFVHTTPIKGWKTIECRQSGKARWFYGASGLYSSESAMSQP